MSNPTVPLGVRFPVRLLKLIDTRAHAARMDRSPYIVSMLEGEQPELCPALAALADITAIREHLLAGGDHADAVERLTELVHILCRAAAREADQ